MNIVWAITTKRNLSRFNMMQDNSDRRSGDRKFLRRFLSDKFHSVEFKVSGLPYLFQFKIWDIFPGHMFILLQETSDILKRIHEGEIFNMKYYKSVSKYPISLKTKIDYIKREKDGRFRNKFLVGLKILPNQKLPPGA